MPEKRKWRVYLGRCEPVKNSVDISSAYPPMIDGVHRSLVFKAALDTGKRLVEVARFQLDNIAGYVRVE